jgi:hypothetical protein
MAMPWQAACYAVSCKLVTIVTVTLMYTLSCKLAQPAWRLTLSLMTNVTVTHIYTLSLLVLQAVQACSGV